MAKRWYVVHVYSGFEKKIAQQLKEQAAQKGLADQFDEVLVPSEQVVEMRRGQKVNAEHKFFPGYVLVKMELSDEAWHLVKDTPKVTGFLGSKTKPSPISEAEAERIMKQTAGGGGAASSGGAVRGGRAGAGRRWTVHQLQRHGGRGRRGEGAPEGQRVDLWPFHAGGAGVWAGGEGLRLQRPVSRVECEARQVSQPDTELHGVRHGVPRSRSFWRFAQNCLDRAVDTARSATIPTPCNSAPYSV